jgi:hypothetical protein
MISNIGKMVAGLCVIFLFCETEDPVAPDFSPEPPCVFPCTVIDGVGTAAITIGMQKKEIEKKMQLDSIDTLSSRLYYYYKDSCDDIYTIEYTDSNTARSIEITSPRIKCAANINVGKKRKDIEAVYGPAIVTPVYQTLNALQYDIEGLIFFVDDSTGLKNIKILAPMELLPVKAGYGSEEINIRSTKKSITTLDYDSISFRPGTTGEYATLIYDNLVYGIWFPNDTTVSRISFGSHIICDATITKRSTNVAVRNMFGVPDTQMQLTSLNEDVYCYIHRGVDFIFDTSGYVIQTVIYPAQ